MIVLGSVLFVTIRIDPRVDFAFKLMLGSLSMTAQCERSTTGATMRGNVISAGSVTAKCQTIRDERKCHWMIH